MNRPRPGTSQTRDPKGKGRSTEPTARRRLRRASRRRTRTDAQGAARRHWNRRRAGQCGSAPQLRNRPTESEVRGLEDGLLTGAIRYRERGPLDNKFKGLVGRPDPIQRYEALARGHKKDLDAAWGKGGEEKTSLTGAEKRRARKGGSPDGGPGARGGRGRLEQGVPA